VRVVRFTAWNIRNVKTEEVPLSDRTNLVVGANGEGKSNLLESVAVLGNLRSFRTTNLRSVVRHGQPSFRLIGRVTQNGGTWDLEQDVTVGPPVRRSLKVNDAEASVAEYLAVAPVFTISRSDRELVVGSPSARRRFLDRFAFLLEPAVIDDLRRYNRSLKHRNAALAAHADDMQLEVWESGLAKAAARLVRRRRAAVRRLAEPLCAISATIAGRRLPVLAVDYRCESWMSDEIGEEMLEHEYRKRYAEQRARDRHAGFTVDGPHRHDLRLRADGRAARDVLSAGQTKVVAAALRLAALERVEHQRGHFLPVLVDDVDAEIDERVFSRLLDHLGADRQLILSSAHEDVVGPRVPGGRRLRMLDGSCVRRDSRGETR